MKKRHYVAVIILAFMFVFTACGNNTDNGSNTGDTGNEGQNQNTESQVTDEQAPQATETPVAQNSKVQVINFDVASSTYMTKANIAMPYSIDGVIGVPAGDGKYPLVLIAHGLHNTENMEARYDQGFSYLVQALAENGYVAVAMDLSYAYAQDYGTGDENERVRFLIEQHMEKLKEANSGALSGYADNLQGMIDFDNVALIGHSRAGEIILDAAMDQIANGVDIEGILSIAPTFDDVHTTYPDVDTAFIVPEYDGDVTTMDGFILYDKMKNRPHDNFISLVLLERGNHNFFNTLLETNDTDSLDGNYDDGLSGSDQQTFLTSFACDFLNAVLLDNADDTWFEEDVISPDQLYGYDVKTSYESGDAISIIDKTKYTTVTEAAAPEYDKTAGFTVPLAGLTEEDVIELIPFTWETMGSSLVFNTTISDISDYDSIYFELAQDSTSDLNNQEDQAFTITLQDKNGDTASVDITKASALRYVDGEMTTADENTGYSVWSNFTPITGLNVPLSMFNGVDLKNIQTVTLTANQNETGSIYIESVKVQ